MLPLLPSRRLFTLGGLFLSANRNIKREIATIHLRISPGRANVATGVVQSPPRPETISARPTAIPPPGRTSMRARSLQAVCVTIFFVSLPPARSNAEEKVFLGYLHSH